MSTEELSTETKHLARMKRMIATVRSLTLRVTADHEIHGRVKSAASARRKAQRLRLPPGRVPDALGIRIILNCREHCYRVKDLIHLAFPHIETEYDDYIGAPKPNGYRSIHTNILDADGLVYEVQIRTRAMHACALRGAAAHHRYKALQTSEKCGPARPPTKRELPKRRHAGTRWESNKGRPDGIHGEVPT